MRRLKSHQCTDLIFYHLPGDVLRVALLYLKGIFVECFSPGGNCPLGGNFVILSSNGCM